MAKRRVVVHYMHEQEAADAAAQMPGSEQTEAYLVGDAEDATIQALRAKGLIVQEIQEQEPETPGRAPAATLLSVAASPRLARVAAALPPAAAVPRPAAAPPPPTAPPPTAAPAAPGAPPAGDLPGYWIAQLAGPLVPSWRDELVKLGVELRERFPRQAYLVALDNESQHAALEKLAFVRSLRPYDTDDTGPVQHARVMRSARPPPAVPGAPAPLAVAPRPKMEPSAPATFDVLLHQEKDLDAIKASAAQLGIEVVDASGRKLRVRASIEAARELASLTPVALVEAWTPPRLFNDRARLLIGADGPNAAPIAFTGKDEIVAVADTGIDEGHPAFEGRLEAVALGRPGDASDPHGHGTHVAATVAGSGAGGRHGTYRGVAPEARIFFQSVMDADGRLSGLPFQLGELFEKAYEKGARIHNDSWGADLRAAYAMSSLEVDEYVWNRKDMLVVIAAGNAGTCVVAPDGPRHAQPGFVQWASVGAPATSKNAIVVGASRSDRAQGGYAALTYGDVWPDDFVDPPTRDERVSGDADAIAAFSSRGPCNDHRLKPDLVAPGTDVVSARSSTAPSTHFGGLAPGTGGAYAFMSGTSMAAPIVAGAAALVRDYLRTKRGSPQPSAALVKAILLNGTRLLKGTSALADHGFVPNFHQGFGRLDLTRSIPLDGSFVLAFSDDWGPGRGLAASGRRQRFELETTAVGPLHITLAYTDAPGRGLQNDVSLFVQDLTSGTRSVGNEQVPLQLQRPDPDNNVEMVRLPAAPKGKYLIQVTATNILRAPQDFALVVSGQLAADVLTPLP